MESHVWKVYENIIILLGCYRLDVCHESVWPPKVAVHDSATDSGAEQQPRKRARFKVTTRPARPQSAPLGLSPALGPGAPGPAGAMVHQHTSFLTPSQHATAPLPPGHFTLHLKAYAAEGMPEAPGSAEMPTSEGAMEEPQPRSSASVGKPSHSQESGALIRTLHVFQSLGAQNSDVSCQQELSARLFWDYWRSYTEMVNFLYFCFTQCKLFCCF